MHTLIGFAVIGIIDLFSCALSGFVLSELWKWFIVPVFKNAPVLSVAHAIGVVLVTTLLTQRFTSYELDGSIPVEQRLKTKLINNFYVPIFIAFLAWLFHEFIF